jgi:MFS transporter, DHA3 family, macrolide efflux protein
MLKVPFTGIRTFYALLLGQFVSIMGSGISRFALGVWVYTETQDTTAYTTLLFFAVFPIGVGALMAGPVVDRWNRRNVMIISDTVAALSTLTVAFLYYLNALELWHLYLALFVNGVATAFSRPALDATVALLVPKPHLNRAAGLSQLVGSLETILSPTIAGFIFGIGGLGATFIIDFVTFGINILLLLLVTIPHLPTATLVRQTSNFREDFRFGLMYVRHRPALIYLLTLFTITMFLLPGVAYSLVTPLVLTFATEQSLGMILSGFGVGPLLGGILITLWGNRWRRMAGILAGMTVVGLAAILISLRESVLLIGVGFVLTGISFVFILGLSRVIWQTKVPPDIMGRVFALQLALGVGAQALGIMVSGPLATVIFEPLLMEQGALAGSVGLWLGTGTGRGIAFMFLFVGLLELSLVFFSVINPSIRLLEDQLPDYEVPAPEPIAVHPKPVV